MSDAEELADDLDVRALKVRMLHHALGGAGQWQDPCAAMLVPKNGLLKKVQEKYLPDILVDLICDPAHRLRVHSGVGPLLIDAIDAEKPRVLDLATAFLDPNAKLRAALLQELTRQRDAHRDVGRRLVSPQSWQRIELLKASLCGDDFEERIGVGIEVHDLLNSDFFFNVAAMRQYLALNSIIDAKDHFARLLAINETMADFLSELPIWDPHRQYEEIQERLQTTIAQASTCSELAVNYFTFFGHLSLGGEFSLAAVVFQWSETHGTNDIWEEIWAWADDNASPLAKYHACKVFLENPDWVPGNQWHVLGAELSTVLQGPSSDPGWEVRCALARYFCLRLNLIGNATDGDRIAAMAWWLAEFLGGFWDGLPTGTQLEFQAILDQEVSSVEEQWRVIQPQATRSALRYATLHCPSLWTLSVLCDLSSTDDLERVLETSTDLISPVAAKLADEQFWCFGHPDGLYAFEQSLQQLVRRVIAVDPASLLAQIDTTVKSLKNGEAIIARLRETNEDTQRIAAHQFRFQACLGKIAHERILSAFSDQDWRKDVLLGASIDSLEIVCQGAVESAQLSRMDDELRAYLPYYIALACAESQSAERQSILFALTMTASISLNSTSAIRMLLTGSQRRQFEADVTDWRQRIATLTCTTPDWVRAQLRAAKSALHIG